MLIGKEGVTLMTDEEFKEILDKEETDTVEFKSWINARNMKEIISFAVDELKVKRRCNVSNGNI